MLSHCETCDEVFFAHSRAACAGAPRPLLNQPGSPPLPPLPASASWHKRGLLWLCEPLKTGG